MRTIDFRYTLIRNGADYGTIKTFQGGEPTVRMSSQGEIKTSLSGSFRIPEKAYDLLSDQIRAEMIIDGTVHPLGIFLPSSVVQVLRTTENSTAPRSGSESRFSMRKVIPPGDGQDLTSKSKES